MSNTHDDFVDNNDRTTEEIYIELRDLEVQAPISEAANASMEPQPALADDDPSGIRARIAHLRALLSDRGAPYE